jgi:hypothetical protein
MKCLYLIPYILPNCRFFYSYTGPQWRRGPERAVVPNIAVPNVAKSVVPNVTIPSDPVPSDVAPYLHNAPI